MATLQERLAQLKNKSTQTSTTQPRAVSSSSIKNRLSSLKSSSSTTKSPVLPFTQQKVNQVAEIAGLKKDPVVPSNDGVVAQKPKWWKWFIGKPTEAEQKYFDEQTFTGQKLNQLGDKLDQVSQNLGDSMDKKLDEKQQRLAKENPNYIPDVDPATGEKNKVGFGQGWKNSVITTKDTFSKLRDKIKNIDPKKAWDSYSKGVDKASEFVAREFLVRPTSIIADSVNEAFGGEKGKYEEGFKAVYGDQEKAPSLQKVYNTLSEEVESSDVASDFEKQAYPALGLAGYVFIENPFNFGGKAAAKTGLKELAKETTEEGVEAILKQGFKNGGEELGEAEIKSLARQIAGESDEKIISDLIDESVNNRNVRESVASYAENSLKNDKGGMRERSVQFYRENPDQISAKPVELREIENGRITILDGRHRLQAARETGEKVTFKDVTPEFTGKKSQKISDILASRNPDNAVKKVSKMLDEKQAAREFKDVGDRVRGSAKEKAAYRSINVSDLQKIDDVSARELVTKSRILKDYDFSVKGAQARGDLDSAGAFIKDKINRSIPSKPLDSKIAREAYVEVIPKMAERLQNAKGSSEILQSLDDTFNDFSEFFTPERLEAMGYSKGNVMNPNYRNAFTTRAIEKTLGKRFANMLKRSTSAAKKVFRDAKNIPEGDYSFAQEVAGRGKLSVGKDGVLRKEEFKPLEHIVREGGRVVDESEITLESMKENYGFKSIQIGNSIPDDEVKIHSRYVIGALKDMEDILGIDMKALNKKGDLSLALAARGKRGAMAHYEASRDIINLTRKRGDGSFGHEMFHFIDDALSEGKDDLLSRGMKPVGRITYKDRNLAREYAGLPYANSMKKLVETIRQSVPTEKTFKPKKDARAVYALPKQYKDRGKTLDDLIKDRKSRGTDEFWQDAINQFGEEKKILITDGRNDFTRNSMRLDGAKKAGTKSAYWSSDVEMLARSFQSYLDDKMIEGRVKNNYLTSTTLKDTEHAILYPQGADRARIHKAFDEFFDDLRKEFPHKPDTTTPRIDVELDSAKQATDVSKTIEKKPAVKKLTKAEVETPEDVKKKSEAIFGTEESIAKKIEKTEADLEGIKKPEFKKVDTEYEEIVKPQIEEIRSIAREIIEKEKPKTKGDLLEKFIEKTNGKKYHKDVELVENLEKTFDEVQTKKPSVKKIQKKETKKIREIADEPSVKKVEEKTEDIQKKIESERADIIKEYDIAESYNKKKQILSEKLGFTKNPEEELTRKLAAKSRKEAKAAQEKLREISLDVPDETRKEFIQRKIQDRYNRIPVIQRAIEKKKGRKLTDEEDLYLQIELYSGRTQQRIEEATNKVNDFFDRTNKDSLDLDRLDEYMHARHAAERNAHVTKNVDPTIKDGGSGLTNAEAKEILDSFSPEEAAKYSKYADEFHDEVIEKRLQILEESGLMKPEDVEKLRDTFENYVPLKTSQKNQFPSHSGGKGFDARGKSVKRLKGSTRKDRVSPIAQSIIELEETIIKAEKNKVLKDLKKMMKDNPDPKLWSVEPQKYSPVYNKYGDVEYVKPTKGNLPDNVAVVYEDGKAYHLIMEDELLARAMKNLGTEKGIKALQTFNNYFRAVVTSYNPEFLITNFERDIQAAAINLAGEESPKLAAKVVKDVPSAIKGVWKNVRGKKPSVKKSGINWAREYQELKETGGRMGWFSVDNVEVKSKKIKNLVRRKNNKRAQDKFLNGLEKVGDFVDNANESVESAVRLSAYVNAKSAGMSKERAAQLAKNLTVNFNKKGELGSALNSLYMFSNAGIQGTARIFKSLHKKRTRKIVAGIAAASYGITQYNRTVNPEGYEQLSDHEKNMNLIIMLPAGQDVPKGILNNKITSGETKNGGHKYIKIALPYGYNIFSVIGNRANDLVNNDYSVGNGLKETLLAMDGAFNPISSASLLQAASPTITDPVVQMVENKAFHGGNIKPDQEPYGRKKPESELYYPSARKASVATAQWLNRVTGGTTVEKGAIDVSPENIDHILDFIAGGAGKFINNLFETGLSLGKGEAPETKNTPFVRRVVGETYKDQERSIAYDILEQSENSIINERDFDKFVRNLGAAAGEGSVEDDRGADMFKDLLANQANVYAGRLFNIMETTDDPEKAMSKLQKAMKDKRPEITDDMIAKELKKLMKDQIKMDIKVEESRQ